MKTETIKHTTDATTPNVAEIMRRLEIALVDAVEERLSRKVIEAHAKRFPEMHRES